MSEVDPGEGWRLLGDGERRQEGDEYRSGDQWLPAKNGFFPLYSGLVVRRRVPAATADARTPEPVAWGFATPDGNLMHVSTFQPAPGTPFVVPLYAAPHPWCRDVARDEAIRCAEDAAKVTLPEWRELPQSVAELWGKLAELEHQAEVDRRVDAGCHYQIIDRLLALEQGDDLPAWAALRERVAALESAAKAAPAANADAEAKLAEAAMMPLAIAERNAVAHAADVLEEMEDGDGNPLAPLAHTLRSLLIRASNEEGWMRELVKRRDEAIRERDEARARVAGLEATAVTLCDSELQASREIRRLKARVAELERRNGEGGST